MRNFMMVGLLAASLLQEQAPVPPTSPESGAQATTPKPNVTLPAGTRIQVTLNSPIRTKFAHRGDIVYAGTAFPVAINGQMAIPTGTYLEGMLEKVLKRGPSGHLGLQMHFTRMVFASGYTVSLQKATAVASALSPTGNLALDSASSIEPTNTGATASAEAFGQSPQQQPPTLTPPPMPGPHIGTVVGIGAGVTAAGIIGGILWARHGRGDVVFEVGSPFEVVLDSPVSVQTDRFLAADATSATQ